MPSVAPEKDRPVPEAGTRVEGPEADLAHFLPEAVHPTGDVAVPFVAAAELPVRVGSPGE